MKSLDKQMGEVPASRIILHAHTKTLRAVIARTMGEALLRGPERLVPPRSVSRRTWLEWEIRLWMYTQYRQPMRYMSLYSVANVLRPKKLSPVIRVSEWNHMDARLAAMRESTFDFGAVGANLYQIADAGVEGLNELVWRLARVMVDIEPALDPVLGTQPVDRNLPAATIRGAEYRDTRGTRNVEWVVGYSPKADRAHEELWSRLTRCRRSRPLSKWRSEYALDPRLYAAIDHALGSQR